MLELKHITKTYKTGDVTQHALKDVSICFRESEFVSVLGHSGSGKTTLLNIVGGLDQYTSGDLVINGVSTKKYRDRDWDIYRNHSVGFVFQSYNLIAHQSVLANVELALTLSGVSKKERRAKALEALSRVGLADQTYKKPNQLSGGQMQRVAIARALINDPDVLLADEPTGALDTDTSIQVMELLKEISREKLVVMVTHNPELADRYSTRIIKLVDGRVVDDTEPCKGGELPHSDTGKKRGRAVRGRSMSVFTAFSLSLNNLMTKKMRTFMTSFAGSIGIMGIALILSVSNGFQNYIDRIQEDTLSTYPLTIESETADMSAFIAAAGAGTQPEDEPEPDGRVTEQQMISEMFARIGTNDVAAFRDYYEENGADIRGGINAVQYGYSLSPQIYSSDLSNGIVKVNPSNMFSSLMGAASSMYTNTGVFHEMMDNRELLDSQYELRAGRWPQSYDELVFVLPSDGKLSDYIVYTLGMRDQSELNDMVSKIMNGEEVEVNGQPLSWEYSDLLELSFRLVAAGDCYSYNGDYNVFEDMTDDDEYMEQLINDGVELHVVGVVCPREGVSASALSQGLAYTSALTDHVISTALGKDIVKRQLENEDIDVFTGRSFAEIEADEERGGLDFNDMISIDTAMLSSAFGVQLSEQDVQALMVPYINGISASITTDTAPAQADFTSALETMCKGMFDDFVAANKDPVTGIAVIKYSDAGTVAGDYVASASAQQLISSLTASYAIPAQNLTTAYKALLEGAFNSYVAGYAAAAGDPTIVEAPITDIQVDTAVSAYMSSPQITATCAQFGTAMTEAAMQKSILGSVTELSGKLVAKVAGSFNVDENKIASAFNFALDEEELTRLMQAYTNPAEDASFEGNLKMLGYADKSKPSSMAIYLVDFDGKEAFLDFLDGYNEKMEAQDKGDYVISYTDLTGVLMSSVKTIVDSVSYVLIAFVAISLVVSSIMIGVITFISVLERTKEIGILRAVGASKKDISRVFNAETIIVGLGAGFIGIAGTLLLLIPINLLLHSLTGVESLNALLPPGSATVLVLISVMLTFISGLIPSGAAARKNPVEALRTE